MCCSSDSYTCGMTVSLDLMSYRPICVQCLCHLLWCLWDSYTCGMTVSLYRSMCGLYVCETVIPVEWHAVSLDLRSYRSMCGLCLWDSYTCGITVSLDLRSYKPMCAMFMPSILMEPPAGSMMRNKDSVMEDLPAPVRPTTPTCNKINITWIM